MRMVVKLKGQYESQWLWVYEVYQDQEIMPRCAKGCGDVAGSSSSVVTYPLLLEIRLAHSVDPRQNVPAPPLSPLGSSVDFDHHCFVSNSLSIDIFIFKQFVIIKKQQHFYMNLTRNTLFSPSCLLLLFLLFKH